MQLCRSRIPGNSCPKYVSTTYPPLMAIGTGVLSPHFTGRLLSTRMASVARMAKPMTNLLTYLPRKSTLFSMMRPSFCEFYHHPIPLVIIAANTAAITKNGVHRPSMKRLIAPSPKVGQI